MLAYTVGPWPYPQDLARNVCQGQTLWGRFHKDLRLVTYGSKISLLLCIAWMLKTVFSKCTSLFRYDRKLLAYDLNAIAIRACTIKHITAVILAV